MEFIRRHGPVSIVIATRNRADELSSTLEILGLTCPESPIIVVDNDSTDTTRAVVAGSPLDVRYVALSTNEGGAARNAGVDAASTSYVAFCDDDTYWKPGALDRAVGLFEEHSRLGLIAGRTVVGDQEREDPVNALMEHSLIGTAPGAPGPSVMGFLAGASIVRKAAFRAAGGFSSLLHFGGEETLLAYDLSSQGWELCYVADVVSHHRPSVRRMSDPDRRSLQIRNRFLTSVLRRPLRVCVREAGVLARSVLAEPTGLRTVANTAALFPRALANRDVVPRDVESRINLVERSRQ